VETPSQWAERGDPGKFTIVVAVHNPGADLAQLSREAAAYGARRVVLPVELHQIFSERLAADFFLGPPTSYAARAAEIAAARGLLADDISRIWFDRALEFRLGGDYGVLPAPSPADQYRPADLPRWREPLRMVDCGAYDGDTLRQFAADNYRLDAYAAFEADPANFARLAAEPALPAERVLSPCAVGARKGKLRFAAGEGGASHVDEAGDLTVDCVTLDDAIPDFRPTLVKMDVEGAEADALAGGAALIARYRPGLAISAYHRPEHLWALARQVQAWELGYRLHLRGHAHSSFDLVLYAVPE
jgi:FkbM family methyltransferase